MSKSDYTPHITVKRLYNAIQYDVLLHAAPQKLRQGVNQSLYS